MSTASGVRGSRRREARGTALGWPRRGWSGGVVRSELLRAPRRSAAGGVVGRRSRLGPERPGLGCSPEVRAGDEEGLGVGCLTRADPRPLLRRRGGRLSGSPFGPDPCLRRGRLGKEAPSCWQRKSPSVLSGLPQSPEPTGRRHVLPGPCADRRVPSSDAVPDTSFPPTCFAESFVPHFNSFPCGNPLLLSGQPRDRWREPLELLTPSWR